MSKETLFINAAIQNREFSLDDKPHKAMGIVAARVLSHFVGSEDIIHCWNNVGLFRDTTTSTKDRLDLKYTSKFMQRHIDRWGDHERVHIYGDDDEQFKNWGQVIINDALRRGDIYQDIDAFAVCTHCGLTIGVVSGGNTIMQCSNCQTSEAVKTKSKLGLFVDIPSDLATNLKSNHLYISNNIRQEVNSFSQLPPRLLLSRDRDDGIPLDSIDMPGMRIDPRLGIGLLSVYLATQRSYERAGIVQSYSTILRTVPYLNSVLRDTNNYSVADFTYAFHSKIERSLLQGDGAITPELLCIEALTKKVDVSKVHVSKILSQRQSILKRHSIVEHFIDDAYSSDFAPVLSTSAAQNGRQFKTVLTSLNKDLGKSIESLKHGRIVEDDSLKAAHQLCAEVEGLLPVLGHHNDGEGSRHNHL